MSQLRLPRPTLPLRVFLSTAVAVTLLFALAGWLLLRQASEALAEVVEEEVRGSLASVEALWRSREESMRQTSAMLSAMSDIRAAFGTKDPATIQDTAAEIWARGASRGTMLLVARAEDGRILAGVGPVARGLALPAGWLDSARKHFPKQASGFANWNGSLWQVVVTPVYVDGSSAENPVLLNVLLTAEPVDAPTLARLRADTGGTEFAVAFGGTVVADEPPTATRIGPSVSRQLELKGIEGQVIGSLTARRPLQLVESRIEELRRTILGVWFGTMLTGLAVSFWLTRRITDPLRELERAARAVGNEIYSVRVSEASPDELGLLAKAFNRMCESIEGTRAELIRREQVHAAGRLAASIAHDLRNPLSAVTGGAEMIAEMDLNPEQTRRAARNVHTAAMRMQHMLEELSQSVRKKSAVRTKEDLQEIIGGAIQSQKEKLESRGVTVVVELPQGIKVLVERGRVERVFINLISNAVDALQGSKGEVHIRGEVEGSTAVVRVRDTGPGIPAEIRATLFQPFVTMGKKGGLGLGLALSRQTMLDHGGDMEAEHSESGALFQLRLPVESLEP